MFHKLTAMRHFSLMGVGVLCGPDFRGLRVCVYMYMREKENKGIIYPAINECEIIPQRISSKFPRHRFVSRPEFVKVNGTKKRILRINKEKNLHFLIAGIIRLDFINSFLRSSIALEFKGEFTVCS